VVGGGSIIRINFRDATILVFSECHELTLPLMYQSLSLREGRAPGALGQTRKDAPENDCENKYADGGSDGNDEDGRMTKTVTGACRVAMEIVDGAWGYLAGGEKVWVVVTQAHVEALKRSGGLKERAIALNAENKGDGAETRSVRAEA
jgi:hypothetical protein